MKRINNKQKALNTPANNQSGLFRALIFGFVACVSLWIVLTVIASLVLSGVDDASKFSGIVSALISIISLVAGGFAAGKTDKSNAFLCAMFLGTAVLGICYGLSLALELSRGIGGAVKTLLIVVMLVSPLVGAKLSCRNRHKITHHRKRM